MQFLSGITENSRKTLGPFLGFVFCLYFIFHFVQGDRGVLAYLRLKQEVGKAEVILAEVGTEKDHLEKKISLLHPDHMDRDMLEERVRDTLGYVGEGETMVVLPPQSSSSH